MQSSITIDRNDEAMRLLRSQVEGAVLTADDPEYESARQGWNLAVQQFPSVIVRAESVSDIQAVVEFANRVSLPVAVMATGHGQFRACNGGVMVNLASLNHVVVDEGRKVAYIGGGAMWKDVLEVTHRAGLVGPSGSAPHVGVVGYLLGGGFPIMGRTHGLGVDWILSMQLVLADGSLVTASPTENEDLFWAIRGGGGGFGIVAEIEMRLIEQPQVYGGAVFFPAELAREIYPKFLAWTRTLPDEVTSTIDLMFFPPVPFIPEPLRGKSFVFIEACVTADESTAVDLLRPMRELPGAVMDSFRMMPYTESGCIYNDPVDPLPANGDGVLLRDLSDEALARMLDAIGPIHESPNLKVQLRHLGGKFRGEGCHPSAVTRRAEAGYLVYMLGVPLPPNSREAMHAHATNVFEALGDLVVCPGPLNFIGEGNVPASKVKSVFGEADYARLVEIKKARDPQNRFAFAGLGIEE